MYNQIPLRISLKNGETEYSFITDVDIRKWLPGDISECFSVTLPQGVKTGKYAIGITLSGDDTPVVRWETEGQSDGAYLTVGELRIL